MRIASPRDRARVDQESTALAALVAGGGGVSRVSVTVNGLEVARLEPKTPQRALPVNVALKLREGANTVVVTATEPDGRVSQEVRTFTYERVVPLTVDMRYPTDQLQVAQASSVVAAMVTSSKGVAEVGVTVNGISVHQQRERDPQKSVAVTVPVTLRDGVNAIVLTAREPDGTVRQEIRTVLLTAPRPAALAPSPPPAPAAPDAL